MFWCQQIQHKIFDFGSVRGAELLNGFGRRLFRRRILYTQHQHQFGQRHQIFGLQLPEIGVYAALRLYNIDYAYRRANANAIGACDNHFRRVQRAAREAGVVNRFQRRQQLRNVRPKSCFR